MKDQGIWIDFSNDPPAEERLVVVVQLDGTCTVARRVYYPGDGTRGSSGWLWEVPGGDGSPLGFLENPVTHWLPLPALPPGRQPVAEWRGPTMRKRAAHGR